MRTRAVLYTLLLVLAYQLPWRLLGLVAETLVMRPGITRMTAGHERYWDARDLQTRLEELGWTVKYEPGLSVYGTPAYGVTTPAERLIEIDAELGWDGRLATLAHEGGHVFQPVWLSPREREAFAECVALLVARDGPREHARYLASAKWELVLVTLGEWPRIYRAAEVLGGE